MSATQRRSSATAEESAPKRRLNVAVFDAEAAKRGATTNDQRAELVGIDRATLFRWRNGQVSPGIDNAMRIAEELGVSVDKLWPLEGEAA